MFRSVFAAAVGNRRLLRTPLSYKHLSAVIGGGGATAVGFTLAKQLGIDASFNQRLVSHCDEALIKLPDVRPTPIIAVSIKEAGLWQRFVTSTKQSVYAAAKTAHSLIRYTERLLIYSFYGIPVLGFLPFYVTLGSIFPAVEEFLWEYMLWTSQRLGPCFIKLAQWASTRPDLFPPKLVDKLIRLQDDVPTYYPLSAVHKTMKIAFGEKWQDLIKLDKKPIGAGCVAQVFRGQISDVDTGEVTDVAVKMIHPYVEDMVNTDMELLTMFANFIDRFPSLEVISLGETIRQFSDMMRRQLDLRVEASNLQLFGSKFKAEKWAVFPQPIDGMVTKHVLVETLMLGKPIAQYMKLPSVEGDSNHSLKMKLADLGCRLILKMVFFDNFIHADLHPGNVLVRMRPDGEPQLIVLDCGLVYYARSHEEFRHLVDICYSFMKHDGRAAARHMVAHNETNVKNADEFIEGIQGMVESAEELQYFEHIGDYVSLICRLAREHCVRLDPGYFKIAMALKVAEGIALSLNREIDMVSKCIPILAKAESMRALGIQKFPVPEEDEKRLVNMLPHNTPEHPFYHKYKAKQEQEQRQKQQTKQ